MQNPREDGATFAPDDICWIDFESRSGEPIRTAGTYRYATNADAIVLAYAIGDHGPNVAAVSDFDAPLHAGRLPSDLKRFHERVLQGTAVYAAWNAGFDKAIWNYSTLAFPELKPHHIIDVMVQATASGLAPDLALAAKQSQSIHKDDAGKGLIKLFCLPESTATPQSHPTEWRQFAHEYAVGDILAMRSVFRGTRQLPLAEWQEYWAMEAINERGVRVDLEMARHAALLAAEDKTYSNAELYRITEGAVSTVDQVKRMSEWLVARMPAEGRDILTKRAEETDDEGVVTSEAKYSLKRRQVERLIAFCDSRLEAPANEDLKDVKRVLQIRLYGGSRTPTKFKKMVDQNVDGVLFGQYVFNGASQTGRASSKGVQVHNLARDTLEHEYELIQALLDGVDYSAFAAIGGDDPVARKLSLLIRPSFIPAPPHNVFVWSDWSSIELRITPWLADHYAGARARLQILRDVDADPSIPDIYTRTAASLSHIPIAKVTKPIRQRGKVVELALTFCGGVGALQNMAAGYGMHIPADEAKATVDQWRKENPWVADFAQELWAGMSMARKLPGELFQVGRIGMVFLKHYLGGSLLCRLPSGRFLTYRALREERVEILNDDDEVIGTEWKTTFRRGRGRIVLWPGLLVENFTQATAADVLRGTLVRLESNGFNVRLHTHDEVLIECHESLARDMQEELRLVMQQGFDWSEGLPLMSEETAAYYYTKNEEEHGI